MLAWRSDVSAWTTGRYLVGMIESFLFKLVVWRARNLQTDGNKDDFI